MALPAPRLDDRTFAQLLEEARAQIALRSPEWTDLSPGDPGIVLLEVFAFLTETMIYRLNRLPDKAYVQFLNLLGVHLLPPQVASTMLLFKEAQAAKKDVTIPRGTRVSVARPDSGSDAPIFTVARTVILPAGQTEVTLPAYHCDLLDGELVGLGTGRGGLSFTVAHPPVVAATHEELELAVGVEVLPGELEERVPARDYAGKTFRIWREVANFTEIGSDAFVYVADRAAGTIVFAPALQAKDTNGTLAPTAATLAEVPAAGREVRVWYAKGGGPLGNVAAQTLTVLKSPLPGMSVTNPAAAVGGRSIETLENALVRGPQEFHSLQRAVTARDFELLARRSGAVSRARAFTKASLWSYASPGTVEVVLVPDLDENSRGGRISREQMEALQTEGARQQIQMSLDEQRPLGTTCVVSWAHYTTVKVRCRIVARAEEDPAALRARVLARLYELISPLPTGTRNGWRFGQALRSSHLYDAVLADTGVLYVDSIELLVEDTPDAEVQCLAADSFQASTWYSGSHSTLYRSMDDGDGWSVIGTFPEQQVYSVQSHPLTPGMVAVCARTLSGPAGTHLYVSSDCGENWTKKAVLAFDVTDMAWMSRDECEYLMLATRVGLFELSMQPGASAEQVFVRAEDEKIGYYAVAVAHLKTGVTVAVASRALGGIYLSDQAGKSNSFRSIGNAGQDVRVLAVQTTGGRSFLWAGTAAPSAGDPGKGPTSWAILGNGQDPPEDWIAFTKDWIGGSCVELAFQGDRVLAATFDAGVLWLEQRATGQAWNAPGIDCGLPQASREHPFDRVDAIATDGSRKVLLTGGRSGIFKGSDGSGQYSRASCRSFADKVTLPPNWLFCSAEHELEVVIEDEGNKN